MQKKKTHVRKKSKSGFLIAFLVCALAVGAVASYVKIARANRVPSYERRQTPADETQPEGLTHRKRHATKSSKSRDAQGPFLFIPSMSEDGKLSFDKQPLDIPDDEDPRVYVINRFLQDTHIVDADARLLSIDVHDGIASLSFNEAMKRTYGTDDESVLLNGLLTNLGQFPEIESATFLVNGEPIDTFGSVDLTEKQTVIRDVHPDSTTQTQTHQPSAAN